MSQLFFKAIFQGQSNFLRLMQFFRVKAIFQGQSNFKLNDFKLKTILLSDCFFIILIQNCFGKI